MIQSRFFPLARMVAASATLISRQLRANLISNGSFESPAEALGLSSVRPTGWTGYAGFGNGLVNAPALMAGGPTLYPAAFDGNQYADLAAGELVTEFTVAIPGDYVLSWYDNSLTTGWNGSYSLDIKNSASAKLISTAFSINYLTQSPPWRALSADLPNLAVGTYTLAFGPGTTSTFLDDVSLEPKTRTSSAPDSGSTSMLLASALLGIGALARPPKSRHQTK